MTVEELLKYHEKEGKKLGRLEGRLEGKLEGRQEGKKEERARLAEVTKHMLASGDGDKILQLLEDDEFYETMLEKYNLKEYQLI